MRTDATRAARSWPGRLVLSFLVLLPCAGGLGAQEITLFDVAAYPGAITLGPDGRLLWVTFFPTAAIGLVSMAGAVGSFPIPNTAGDITAGPDGNLWYTASAGRIGRITPTGTVTEFFLGSLAFPKEITAGPDGNLWFTDPNDNVIGRITVAGAVTEFSVPSSGSFGNRLDGIAAGPDGNIWFTEGNTNKIGRITPDGIITEFDLPGPRGPHGITAGPDGNLWFTERSGGIGKITPEGIITEYPIPSFQPWPLAITSGPDGNVWFLNSSVRPAIGRVSMSGTITEFPAPQAIDIAGGPDGNIWFTSADNRLPGPRIGRLNIAGLGACVAGPAALCLNNSRFRVQVSFRPPGLPSPREAQTLPLPATDTGAFWFFDSSNLELMVKVLDGRTINGKFWVFYGSLTNVEFTLTVTDTETGAVRTYENVQGQLASAADTAAF